MKKSIEAQELDNWRARLIGAWLFAFPLALLMILERLLGIMLFDESVLSIIILGLAFPVVFIFGWQTITGGLRGFYTFYFNMDSLIALGTIVAYLTGPLSYIGFMQDYSGIAAMIMAIFITGKYIETKAKGRASEEIRKLL